MPDNTRRPGANPRSYAFKDLVGNETPGIALWGSKGLLAHLTHAEALTLTDRLHDLVNAAGNPESASTTNPNTPRSH